MPLIDPPGKTCEDDPWAGGDPPGKEETNRTARTGRTASTTAISCRTMTEHDIP